MTTTIQTLSWQCQYDTAAFPSSSPVDFDALGCDVDLGVDSDCGSATIQVESIPGSVVEGVRIYIFAGFGSTSLIFNGYCTGLNWNEDGTAVIVCQDALAKLRNAWGGTDRTYNSTLPDTDTSTAQNVVEASGIDASLTSIQGEGRTLGTAQDVVIHGGDLDISGNPSTADVMIDFIRLLDKSVIPNYVTFTRGNGAVYRRTRVIGGSVASFSDGSGDAWGFTRRREGRDSIINKVLVKGLTVAGVPTEAVSSASNALLPAPFEYNTLEFPSYLVDDPTWAQALADWIVGEKNGRLNVVTWTTALENTSGILGATVTLTSSQRDLSSKAAYCTAVKHHIDAKTATTTFTAEFRD